MFANSTTWNAIPSPPAAPLPIPEDLSSNDLMRQGITALPARSSAVSAGRCRGDRCGREGGRRTRFGGVRRHRLRRSSGGGTTGGRTVALAARRSLSTRTEAIDIPLCDLHRRPRRPKVRSTMPTWPACAVRSRRYHEALGVPIATLPMAVPVNLRADSDPAGGNRFAGVNLAAPIGTAIPRPDSKIRSQMTARRDEAAINVLGAMAPILSACCRTRCSRR